MDCLFRFKHELIDAIVLVEQPERGLEALRQRVNGRSLQTLVVDTAHFERNANVPGLGEEGVRPDEPEQIHHRIERTTSS